MKEHSTKQTMTLDANKQLQMDYNLPRIESVDRDNYHVLDTSYCTRDEMNMFQCLEAF